MTDRAPAQSRICYVRSLTRRVRPRALQGAEALKRANPALAVGLGAACDLFMRYVTRTSALESGDFSTCKVRVRLTRLGPHTLVPTHLHA